MEGQIRASDDVHCPTEGHILRDLRGIRGSPGCEVAMVSSRRISAPRDSSASETDTALKAQSDAGCCEARQKAGD